MNTKLMTIALAATLFAGSNLAFAAEPRPENSDDRMLVPEYTDFTRNIISIPDIDGYKTLKCDFHLHTMFADAQVSPEGRVVEAWSDGLDVVCVSEHVGVYKSPGIRNNNLNLIQERAVSQGKKLGMLVVKGVEVTRAKPFGHMNMLFLEDCNVFCEERYLWDENGNEKLDENGEKIPNRATEITDFKAAEAQHAFIQWNHPGWPDKISDLPEFHREMIQQHRIHSVELFNSVEWYPKVLDWFEEYGIPMVANSDAHKPIRVQYNGIRPMTLVFAKEYTMESLRESMFAGRMVAFFNNTLAGKADYLDQLVSHSLNVRVINKKKGLVEIANNSDICYKALWGSHMNPVVFYPHKAIQVTLPEGTEVEFINCLVGRKCLKTVLW